MPAALTADALLTRVKARAQVPSADGRLSDAEILVICDDIIRDDIGLSAYEADDGRWVVTAADVSITSGVASYRVPTRAWSAGIQTVALIDSSGNELPIGRVDHHEIGDWKAGGVWQDPRWALIGDAIHLLPTPTDSLYSLRVRYIRRPSTLALIATCGLISGSTSTTLTISADPVPDFAASPTLDVVRGSHHGDTLGDSVAMTWSTPTLTYTAGALASTGALVPASGDYACPEGTSCVVQVPDVCVRYLTLAAARDVCEAFGDDPGFARMSAAAGAAHKQMDAALAERSRVRPKIIPKNSPLRAGSGARGRRRGWWGR